MKIKNILPAAKISLHLFRSLVTGKVAKGLEKAEQAVDIAQAVERMIAREKRKK